MAKQRWLVSTRKQNLKFLVVSFSRAPDNMITAELKGADGGVFTKSFTPESLENMGYRLQVLDAPDGDTMEASTA